MSDFLTVQATSRDTKGKGASRRLRHSNQVPAIVYGAGKDAVSITLPLTEVMKHLAHENFYSSILTLITDGKGKGQKVVLRDVQRHPFRDEAMHIDFQRVDAKKPIVMNIPLHFINEKKSPGTKAGAGFRHVLHEVKVKGLAKNMPEYIEVDLAEMNVEDTIMLSDIEFPKGIKSVALSRGASHDAAVVVCTKTK